MESNEMEIAIGNIQARLDSVEIYCEALLKRVRELETKFIPLERMGHRHDVNIATGEGWKE